MSCLLRHVKVTYFVFDLFGKITVALGDSSYLTQSFIPGLEAPMTLVGL